MAVQKTTSKSLALTILLFLGLVFGGVDKASSTRDIPDEPVRGLTVHASNEDSEKSVLPEAGYPVKWGTDETPPAAPPFWRESAYPVKWNIRESPPAAHPDTRVNALKEDTDGSILPEATYPVKWDNNDSPPVAPPVTERAAPAPGHGLHVQKGMLFLRTSLYPGATLPQGTKLATNGSTSPREFMSKVNSDVAPFGYGHLDDILALFSIPSGSKMAAQVASTLRTCEESFGQPHTCATSAEAAAEFAAAALGTSHLRRVVSIVHGNEPSRYLVAANGIKRIGAPGAALVPCHPMPYPFVVRFCHKPENVEALSVELIGEAGAKGSATAVAVCHKNTAIWDQRYFEMLNATRGDEICHFMPENYLLWVSADAQ